MAPLPQAIPSAEQFSEQVGKVPEYTMYILCGFSEFITLCAYAQHGYAFGHVSLCMYVCMCMYVAKKLPV